MLDSSGRFGFTLFELPVVIAIIAILAAMLLPTLTRAKAKVAVPDCLGYFKQLQTRGGSTPVAGVIRLLATP